MTKKNYCNQSEHKSIFFGDLSERMDPNFEITSHLVPVALARFGREKRGYRESWMFCLGFILRRTDTNLGGLFLRPFAFGDEF